MNSGCAGTGLDSLQSQRAQSRVIIRTTAQGPVVLAIGFLDGQVVDAGNAHTHQSFAIELPVLVSVGAEMLAAVVAPLVGEAHRDPVVVAGPHFLDEAVIELPGPFARQKGDDLLAALDELRTVAPAAVLCVRK